jgi:hypothetical protein
MGKRAGQGFVSEIRRCAPSGSTFRRGEWRMQPLIIAPTAYRKPRVHSLVSSRSPLPRPLARTQHPYRLVPIPPWLYRLHHHCASFPTTAPSSHAAEFAALLSSTTTGADFFRRMVRGIGLVLVLLCWTTAAVARNYTLRDEITGRKFLDAFYFWAYNDPTNGTVEYVDELTAVAKRLAYVDPNGRFVMRADNTTLIPSGKGRPSVRIHSKRKVADGIIVGKFSHMPQGCATWPAFWTCTTEQWPRGGEIDIVEGANDQGPRNLASLHTLYGCHIPGGSRSDQTGFTGQADCSYQPGCSASFNADRSYGPGFNANGGGYFAVRRETRPGDPGIGVYFWPITTAISSLPAAVAAAADGTSAPKYVVTNSNATGNDRSELSKWGTPAAFFANTPNATASQTALATGQGSVCQMENYFDEHEIIINLSLCGDWAGETFGYSGCAARYGNVSCETFVRNNPAAFSDARWEIDYLRIYDNAASSMHLNSVGCILAAVLSIALLL